MTDLDASISIDDVIFKLEECVSELREAQDETESSHTGDLVNKWVATLHRLMVDMQDESDRLYPIPIEELRDFMSSEEIEEELQRREKWKGVE